MPNINTDGLTDPLVKAQSHIIEAIGILDDHAKSLKQFDGVIAETMPLNIKSAIEKLLDIVGDPTNAETGVDTSQGQNLDSLSKMIAFLGDIPVKALSKKGPIVQGAPTINRAAMAKEINTVSDDGVDVTPHTDGGPKSAVAASLQDSVLDKYLKRAPKLAESEKLKEKQHILSLDITLDDDGIGNDVAVAYDEGDHASEYLGSDEYDDEQEYVDDSAEADPDSWKSVSARNARPEDKAFSFDDIMEDPDLANGDDDDLGLDAFNLNSVPKELMQRRQPVAAPIDNVDDFDVDGDEDDGLGDTFGEGLDDDTTYIDASSETEAPEIETPEVTPVETQKYTAGQKQMMAKGLPVIPKATANMNRDWRTLVKNDPDVSFGAVAGRQ